MKVVIIIYYLFKSIYFSTIFLLISSPLLLYQDKSLLFLKDICDFWQNISATHKNGFKVCFDGGEPQQQEWRRRSYCKPYGEVGRCQWI